MFFHLNLEKGTLIIMSDSPTLAQDMDALVNASQTIITAFVTARNSASQAHQDLIAAQALMADAHVKLTQDDATIAQQADALAQAQAAVAQALAAQKTIETVTSQLQEAVNGPNSPNIAPTDPPAPVEGGSVV